MSLYTPKDLKKIEFVNVRDVWENEARDFTPWLYEQENLSLLGEAVGLDIQKNEREKNTPDGNFRADLYCNIDGEKLKVVVENQLEITDHKHLGQIAIYKSNLKDAEYGIWVVPEYKPEIRETVKNFNNHGLKVFLVLVEVLKIGDSIAPYFQVIEEPNPYVKIINSYSKFQLELIQNDFWESFNKYATQELCNEVTSIPKPNEGRIGIYELNLKGCDQFKIRISLGKNKIEYKIYISKKDKDSNKEIYHKFESHRDEIEKDLNRVGLLKWNENPNKDSSNILLFTEKYEFSDQKDLSKTKVKHMCEMIVEYIQVFKKWAHAD